MGSHSRIGSLTFRVPNSKGTMIQMNCGECPLFSSLQLARQLRGELLLARGLLVQYLQAAHQGQNKMRLLMPYACLLLCQRGFKSLCTGLHGGGGVGLFRGGLHLPGPQSFPNHNCYARDGRRVFEIKNTRPTPKSSVLCSPWHCSMVLYRLCQQIRNHSMSMRSSSKKLRCWVLSSNAS